MLVGLSGVVPLIILDSRLWVLRSAATYPEVMRRELLRLRSNATIKVINSGRVDDTIPNNIARFERRLRARA